MSFALFARFPFVLVLLPVLVGCAQNRAWTTRLAPSRPGRGIDCPVVETSDPPKAGMENLGFVRCEYTGFGEGCMDLARQQACTIGGNVIYDLHWESGWRVHALVGTIAFDPARDTSAK
jgi:hypothetical protein